MSEFEQKQNRIAKRLCYNFYVGWRQMQALLEPCFSQGMNLQRFYVLELCNANEGVSVSMLADALELDRPSVSGLVQRMEKEGLVIRKKNTSDTRGVWVCRTEHGTGVLLQLYTDLSVAMSNIFEHVSTDQLKNLQNIVNTLMGLDSNDVVNSNQGLNKDTKDVW